MGIVGQSLRRAIDGGEEDDDFTVTLESRQDPDRWIQLTHHLVNMAYPLDTEPAAELARRGFTLPPKVGLVAWEGGKYATFEHAREPFDDLVAFVERYSLEILRVAPEEKAFIIRTE